MDPRFVNKWFLPAAPVSPKLSVLSGQTQCSFSKPNASPKRVQGIWEEFDKAFPRNLSELLITAFLKITRQTTS